MDSQYDILGAAGVARRWKLRGWVGASRPVSNVVLWEQLLDELDRTQRTIHWVKVPSHVSIEGNNEADRLAERGRHMHPRFPRVHMPRPTPAVCHTKSPYTTQVVPSGLLRKQLHFSPPVAPLSIFSEEAQSSLSALSLLLLPDPEENLQGPSDNESTGAGNSSPYASFSPRSCLTEGSRD